MKKTKSIFHRGDILYHAEHGPCLIRKVERADSLPDGGLCYHLVSKEKNARANQFFVSVEGAEDSGFHRPHTVTEGQKVLDYLKKTGPEPSLPASTQVKLINELARENTLWSSLRVVSIYSHEKDGMRAQGKYRVLVRAARVLIRELAYIFNVPFRSSVEMVRKNLCRGGRTNTWVLDALSHLDDEAGD